MTRWLLSLFLLCAAMFAVGTSFALRASGPVGSLSVVVALATLVVDESPAAPEAAVPGSLSEGQRELEAPEEEPGAPEGAEVASGSARGCFRPDGRSWPSCHSEACPPCGAAGGPLTEYRTRLTRPPNA